ncbi:MAG: recombinase family protein [Limisphaerales bacterium]
MSPDFPDALPPRPVGLWIRVSTDDQAKGDSPKHHEARGRHFAAAKGWAVMEVYDLAGVSGKSVMEHPETKRMLEDVRRGHISGLVFSKLARLTRNARELMDFAEFFRQHNADLVSLQENIDTGTPAGRLFYNMVAVMAQWEREEIADRVRASIAIRAKLGKPLNGKAPFGYRWVDKKLSPDPDEAPVRRLMYQLFAEHRRKKTVARLLNEQGLRTRDGHRFTDTTVGRLIADPTAKGLHRANYTRRVADKRPWALKPEHEWVMTPVEPIVPEELWLRCNDLLETRRTARSRPGKRPVHLFAGLTVCGCGAKMYVPTNTPKYVCGKCRRKIPCADLEGIFLEELKGYLLSPSSAAGYVAQAGAALAARTALLGAQQKDLQRVRQDMDAAVRLYTDGGLNVAQFKERYQPLDDRKRAIEEELPRIEAEAALLKMEGFTVEHIMAEVRGLDARWPQMDPPQRRTLVEMLVKEVVVDDQEVTLTLCYAPSFENMTNRQRTV